MATDFVMNFASGQSDFAMGFSQDNTNTNPSMQQYTLGTGVSYDKVKNKPKIEGVTLEGDKTFQQLGLDAASVQEVEAILYLD